MTIYTAPEEREGRPRTWPWGEGKLEGTAQRSHSPLFSLLSAASSLVPPLPATRGISLKHSLTLPVTCLGLGPGETMEGLYLWPQQPSQLSPPARPAPLSLCSSNEPCPMLCAPLHITLQVSTSQAKPSDPSQASPLRYLQTSHLLGQRPPSLHPGSAALRLGQVWRLPGCPEQPSAQTPDLSPEPRTVPGISQAGLMLWVNE